jgi:hypothetical protein
MKQNKAWEFFGVSMHLGLGKGSSFPGSIKLALLY